MARDLAATKLYHITDIENLPAILQAGCLISDNGLAKARRAPSVIGHNHIKERRMTRYRVPCVGNRFVGEFVPFYYCPRSPMLYTVNMGNTGKPRGCQNGIVHLVTNVALAVQLGRPWAISDINAGAELAEFFDQLTKLDGLDWDAIDARIWNKCASQKAAEFLVADQFEWTAFQTIGCYNAAAAERVRAVMHGHAHQPKVTVEPNWYY